jgi:phage/conjugal plasmid C-4 type zinc finger TraR family protein
VADPIDQANELSERLRTEALAEQRQLARQRALRPSRPDCLECGEEIPAKRQALGGVTRCVVCEALVEATGGGR